MAIKAAKEKADYLLSAIGEQTGKAILVREQSPTTYNLDDSNLNVRGSRSEPNYYYVDGVKTGFSEKEKVIQFEKLKLQAAIYVKFEIK